MIDVLLIGSGGHAKVVIEVVRACGGYRLIGCTDAHRDSGDVLGVPILGDDEKTTDLYRSGLRHAFVALGDNRLRVKIAHRLKAQGFSLPTFVHPSAVISPSAVVGTGTVIMAGAMINACAMVGDYCIVNTGASIDHDCIIAEGCHLAPQTALAGCVETGACAFIGVGASVIPGVKIGKGAIVGAGAAVISDIRPSCVAVGVPARQR